MHCQQNLVENGIEQKYWLAQSDSHDHEYKTQ